MIVGARAVSVLSGKCSLHKGSSTRSVRYQHSRALVARHLLLNTTAAAICLLNI
jgi:hypothetical protein